MIQEYHGYLADSAQMTEDEQNEYSYRSILRERRERKREHGEIKRLIWSLVLA